MNCFYQLKASLNITLVGFNVLNVLNKRDIGFALYYFRKFFLVKELRELVEHALIVGHVLRESFLHSLINLLRHVVFKVFDALLHHLHGRLLLDHGGIYLVREAIPVLLLHEVLVDLVL
jgi:drug/metabolite transporter superfamily protein YnfA